MLVELKTITDYAEIIRAARLDIAQNNDLGKHCAKTWEISANLIKNPALWRLASAKGVEFIRFLRSVTAMRKGFASGRFVYGMLVARKE